MIIMDIDTAGKGIGLGFGMIGMGIGLGFLNDSVKNMKTSSKKSFGYTPVKIPSFKPVKPIKGFKW